MYLQKPLYLLLPIIALSTSQGWAMGTEEIGNAPLSAANYSDWKGIMPLVNDSSRVFQQWVNGNEHLYYDGNVDTLNDFLKNFRAAEMKKHEVILLPGPAVASSFNGEKKIPYQWMLHLVGGISKGILTRDLGEKIWSDSPQVTICVGEKFDLQKLKIPEGIRLLDSKALGERYREALKSSEHSVRGWGANELARLDPHDEENAKAVAALMDDKDVWVRQCVVGALPLFGKQMESQLPKLKELAAKADKNGPGPLAEAIKKIEATKEDPAEEKSYREISERISAFIHAPDNQTPKT
jgi:hypothetical protein